MFEKRKFYKIGKYEFLLNTVDAVTDVYRNQESYQFDIIVDGAVIVIANLPDIHGVRQKIVVAWKGL